MVYYSTHFTWRLTAGYTQGLSLQCLNLLPAEQAGFSFTNDTVIITHLLRCRNEANSESMETVP